MRSKWRVATTALPNEVPGLPDHNLKSDSYFVQTQQFHVIVGLICKEEIICEKCLHR